MMEIATMNAVELVGQSMMLRFEGPVFSETAREAFREIRPGGVLFFADNITSREQVHALTGALQAEARLLGMPPLLIAADQEGGIVSRFPADFVTMPGAMALAATSDPDSIEIAARLTAEQLREVGINTNFAPAIDVNNNPANPVIRTRAWGDTPERVIAGMEAVFRGHEAGNVVTTVKHFPGHGDTHVDSHLGLPTIDADRERIDRIELAPFRAAIAAGVPAIMSAHIIFPALDPEFPATLSYAILTDLLRGELAFDGVVFTDSMSMQAITARYGIAEAAIIAKLAGVDVLEANDSLDDQRIRHEALVDALESGRLSDLQFLPTIDRLDAVRQRYGIDGEPRPLPEQPASLRKTARAIATRTVAHAGGDPFRPVEPAGAVVVDFQRFRTTEAEDPVGRAQVLRDAVAATLPGAEVVTLSDEPTDAETERAVTAAAEARTLVILTRDASDLPRQVALANEIIAAVPETTRVIHCPMRGPYDAGALDRADDLLFVFGDPALSIEALVAALAGESPATARMPVRVPSLDV
jgi:beta-N-acetylhexosaminidase